MFLARATFEVAETPDSTNPAVEGKSFRMALVALDQVTEVGEIPDDGRFATYEQIVGTLTHALPDWAMMASQIPGMNRQYHAIRLTTREEVDRLLEAVNRHAANPRHSQSR